MSKRRGLETNFWCLRATQWSMGHHLPFSGFEKETRKEKKEEAWKSREQRARVSRMLQSRALLFSGTPFLFCSARLFSGGTF